MTLSPRLSALFCHVSKVLLKVKKSLPKTNISGKMRFIDLKHNINSLVALFVLLHTVVAVVFFKLL